MSRKTESISPCCLNKTGIKPLSNIRDQIIILLKQYNRELMDTDKSISKKQLKTLDCIDLTSVISNYNKDLVGDKTGIPSAAALKQIKDQMYENITDSLNFFHYVPCFEEGCFQINKNRWLYFKINNLLLCQNDQTIDRNYVELFIQDYTFSIDTGWTPGIYCNIVIREIKNSENRAPCIETAIINSMLYRDIYKIFSDNYLKSHLCWSETDIDLWNNHIIKFSEKTENKLDENESNKEITTLIRWFVTFTPYVNVMLQKNKLSHGKKPKKISNIQIKTDINKTATQPSKLIRQISTGKSLISITSIKPPKSPDQEYIRHYSVAYWKTRGHIRTYKSGKNVYVKESIHHRKGFDKSEQSKINLQQTILKLN